VNFHQEVRFQNKYDLRGALTVVTKTGDKQVFVILDGGPISTTFHVDVEKLSELAEVFTAAAAAARGAS
jgi:hypothetical protein